MIKVKSLRVKDLIVKCKGDIGGLRRYAGHTKKYYYYRSWGLEYRVQFQV